MAQLFNSAVLTESGTNLLNEAQAGNVGINITRMAIGNGVYEDDEKESSSLQAMTALKSEKNSYSLSKKEVYSDNSVIVTAVLSNYDSVSQVSLISEGYYINEIGLFAQAVALDDDDESEYDEVLYAIAVTAGDTGDYMPPYNGYNAAEIVQSFYCTVANSEETTITTSGASYLAEDGTELEERIDSVEEQIETILSDQTTFKAYMIGNQPNYYARESLFTPNQTSITIHANTQVNINDSGYYSTEDVTLDTSDVAEAGKDVYIYACVPDSGTVPDFVLSQNSTVPDGYDADNSRKIGGFHCLCADVGTISGHTLSGYVAGDILPASVWDLKHRPVSEPEGMVYDEGTGKWYDIYLASWDGSELVSVYGGTIADGASSTPFHGHLFLEKFGLIGKRLMWRHEFMCVAKGSNEQTAIYGEADPGTTGGHVDTESRRMISNIGLEDCCGCLWQWVNDEYEHMIYGTSGASTISYWDSDSGNYYLSSYGWSTTKNAEYEYSIPNYNPDVDDQEYGDAYGLPRQARVGARWGISSYCGSRSVTAGDFGSNANSRSGGRGVSEPRVA